MFVLFLAVGRDAAFLFASINKSAVVLSLCSYVARFVLFCCPLLVHVVCSIFSSTNVQDHCTCDSHDGLRMIRIV